MEKIIYEKAKKFFEKRFERPFNPEVDYYASEWLERFEKGYPEIWMDSKSKDIYIKQILSGKDIKTGDTENYIKEKNYIGKVN